MQDIADATYNQWAKLTGIELFGRASSHSVGWDPLDPPARTLWTPWKSLTSGSTTPAKTGAMFSRLDLSLLILSGGRLWRFSQALILLDYLLHAGSEAIMSYAKENFYVIKTLKEFQYVDEEGKDQGANGAFFLEPYSWIPCWSGWLIVRQKSKEIMMLLADEARLKEERKNRKDMVTRMGPTDDWGYGNNDTYGSGARSMDYRDADLPPTPPPVARPAPVVSNDDAELQRALEESRRTAMEDEKKRTMLTRALSERLDQDNVRQSQWDRTNADRSSNNSEDDLQKAIRLSQADARAKEEEMRRQMARRQQEQDLFDFNTPAIAQQPNQMYQRTDSMSNMGYGQPDYGQGYGFGNDFAQQQQYEANPFGIGSSGDGFGNPFGAAFDGGSGARPLPHQVIWRRIRRRWSMF
jgi:epsin